MREDFTVTIDGKEWSRQEIAEFTGMTLAGVDSRYKRFLHGQKTAGQMLSPKLGVKVYENSYGETLTIREIMAAAHCSESTAGTRAAMFATGKRTKAQTLRRGFLPKSEQFPLQKKKNEEWESLSGTRTRNGQRVVAHDRGGQGKMEKMTDCKCPFCRRDHRLKIFWVGDGTPWKTCKKCGQKNVSY